MAAPVKRTVVHFHPSVKKNRRFVREREREKRVDVQNLFEFENSKKIKNKQYIKDFIVTVQKVYNLAALLYSTRTSCRC